jgi:sulfide:quinone oxidoreductase
LRPDIIVRIADGEGTSAELGARCVMDMGDQGIYMSVNPVRPPRNTIPTLSQGRRWLFAKRAFERIYLFSARHGRRVPTALGWRTDDHPHTSRGRPAGARDPSVPATRA